MTNGWVEKRGSACASSIVTNSVCWMVNAHRPASRTVSVIARPTVALNHCRSRSMNVTTAIGARHNAAARCAKSSKAVSGESRESGSATRQLHGPCRRKAGRASPYVQSHAQIPEGLVCADFAQSLTTNTPHRIGPSGTRSHLALSVVTCAGQRYDQAGSDVPSIMRQ